jgi:hypothetical protein
MRQNDNVLYAAHSCSFLLVNFNLTMQRLDLPRSAMTMATMLIFGPSGYYLHPLWRRRYYNTLGIDYLFTHIPIQTQPPPRNHNIIILSAISTLPPPLPPTAAAYSMTNFRLSTPFSPQIFAIFTPYIFPPYLCAPNPKGAPAFWREGNDIMTQPDATYYVHL